MTKHIIGSIKQYGPLSDTPFSQDLERESLSLLNGKLETIQRADLLTAVLA